MVFILLRRQRKVVYIPEYIDIHYYTNVKINASHDKYICKTIKEVVNSIMCILDYKLWLLLNESRKTVCEIVSPYKVSTPKTK